MNDAERDIEAAALPAGVGADAAVGEVVELEGLDGRLGEVLRGGFRDAVHPRLVHQVTPGRGPTVGAAALRHEANLLPHFRGGTTSRRQARCASLVTQWAVLARGDPLKPPLAYEVHGESHLAKPTMHAHPPQLHQSSCWRADAESLPTPTEPISVPASPQSPN